MKIYYKNDSEVFIRNKKIKEANAVFQTLDHFSGIDIVEAGENFVLAEEKAEIEYSEFNNTMNQLFLNLINQSEKIRNALKYNKKDITDDLLIGERLINQTSDFCLRILNTKGYEEFKKTNFMYEIADGLESLGDHFFYLYKDTAKDSDFKLSNELLFRLNEYIEILKDFYLVFKNFSKKNYKELAEKIIDLKIEFNKSYPYIKKEEIPALLRLFAIINKLGELLEPLIGVHVEKIEIKKDK